MPPGCIGGIMPPGCIGPNRCCGNENAGGGS
jgi:hypothetical protein